MLFYDFEVFKYDWLVVAIDATLRKEHVIVNDPEALRVLYESSRHDIWVGFNSRHYDQYILKGILSGLDPAKLTEWIIVKDRPGWEYSSLLNRFPLNNYDVMPNPPIGLKTMEGFMGSDIKESGVPFDIDRPLTQQEIRETVRYCRHDVEQTAKVFIERKEEFNAQIAMCRTFSLPLSYIGKTEAGITAKVLDCNKRRCDDEFDYFFLPCLEIRKYAHVVEWFRNAKEACTAEMKALRAEAERQMTAAKTERQREKAGRDLQRYDWRDDYLWSKYFYDRSLTVMVCGVPHQFGFGGLHGAPEKPVHKEGLILHVDVGSYYPSMLIAWELVTRASAHPEKYKEIYDTRMALKRAGRKKEQTPYKKLLNALSGAMKDRMNPAYDPMMNNTMCINGQLMLLDLLEHLEVIPGFELIQSNTDGLIIRIPDTDEAFEMVDDVCWEWEQRCSTERCAILLELDQIREIYQKDVNNYLWVGLDGEMERKGAYVKELSTTDYDLPIVNKALVNYMTKKIPVEDTVLGCQELIEFQKVVKLSGKYKWVEWDGKRYSYKSYRVFASKDPTGRICKCGGSRGKPEKFANTPDDCFICNDNIVGATVPGNLDRQWYIDLARKRLRDFGVMT